MQFALDPLQSLNTSSADLWYAFSTAFGRVFLALASGSQAVLYGWRGIYVPVQTLNTNNASGFTYVSPTSGVNLVVVTNRGSPTNREVNSHVYQFTQPEQLSLVRVGVHVLAILLIIIRYEVSESVKLFPLVGNGRSSDLNGKLLLLNIQQSANNYLFYTNF